MPCFTFLDKMPLQVEKHLREFVDLERILNEEESFRGSVKAAVNQELAMLELKEKIKRVEMKLGEKS